MDLDRFLTRLARTVSEIVLAWLLSILASGGEPLVLARIVLAIKLNVFAIPLSWTPALSLPLWVWYVVSVIWIRQWVRISPYSPADVIAEIEEHRWRETRTQRPQQAVTDGGSESEE